MERREIEGLLEEQMVMLSEQSKKFEGKQLIDASFAIAELAKASNCFWIDREMQKASRRY